MKPKVAAFVGKIEYKKCPKAFWNLMTKEQQMQVHRLCKQHGIKPAVKQTSTDTRITALEAKLGIISQPKKGYVKQKEREIPKN